MLAAARNEAIGMQQMRGVFFYIDPTSKLVKCALVRKSSRRRSWSRDRCLSRPGPDRDTFPLPRGVSLQGRR